MVRFFPGCFGEILGVGNVVTVDAVVCLALVVPVQVRLDALAAYVAQRFFLTYDPGPMEPMLGRGLVANY